MRRLHAQANPAEAYARQCSIPRRWLASLAMFGLIAAARPAMAQMDPEVLTPVPVVQDGRLDVRTPGGAGVAVLHVTRDWSTPQPGIRRAIVVIPGWPRRDLHAGEHAAALAGAAAQDTVIVIASPSRRPSRRPFAHKATWNCTAMAGWSCWSGRI